MAAATNSDLRRLRQRHPRARVVNAAVVGGKLTYRLVHADPWELGSLFFPKERVNLCLADEPERVERQQRCQDRDAQVRELMR